MKFAHPSDTPGPGSLALPHRTRVARTRSRTRRTPRSSRSFASRVAAFPAFPVFAVPAHPAVRVRLLVPAVPVRLLVPAVPVRPAKPADIRHRRTTGTATSRLGATLPSQGFPRPPGRAAVPSQQRTPAPAAPPVTPAGLVRLNTAAPDEALTAFLGCCASHRWAQRLTAHRPYRDLETLLAAADEAAYDLAHADLTEALARESRTHPAGGSGRGYSAADTALSAAHAAYESRFGHAFVLCLDDCPPEETLDRVLAAIRTRLGHDPDDERAVTAEELRRLARGRLTRLSRTGPAHHDGAVSDTDRADPAVPEETEPGQNGRKSTGSGRPDSPYASV